jgi:hypothetical protein
VRCNWCNSLLTAGCNSSCLGLTTRDATDTREADTLGRNWYNFFTAGRSSYFPDYHFCVWLYFTSHVSLLRNGFIFPFRFLLVGLEPEICLRIFVRGKLFCYRNYINQIVIVIAIYFVYLHTHKCRKLKERFMRLDILTTVDDFVWSVCDFANWLLTLHWVGSQRALISRVCSRFRLQMVVKVTLWLKGSQPFLEPSPYSVSWLDLSPCMESYCQPWGTVSDYSKALHIIVRLCILYLQKIK